MITRRHFTGALALGGMLSAALARRVSKRRGRVTRRAGIKAD